MNLQEVLAKNCEMLIPTGWNIYEWAKKHPATTIAAGMRRIEKIFDFSDAINMGFSCGKDSTITSNLALMELNLRRLRVQNGIDRDGNNRIDPLDAKWAKKRLHAMYTDAEVCWTSSNDYAKRFLLKYGPKGLDLLEFQWICLPLAWQSGVSFDSGILISWDPDKENIWVQPMPTRDELHGFQPLHIGNLKTANAVPISSLSEKAAAFHRENGNVFTIDASEVFDAAPGASGPVEVVSNYGRGPTLPNFRTGCHEKEEQDDYSFYLSQTTWMIDDPGVSRDSIRNELMQRYDISHDVWVMKPAGPKGLERITTSLISLRAEESLDRRVILSQGEYSTGQYSRNQGCNVCSPVFDWTTSDIWRLFSATDFDVNDVYQKIVRSPPSRPLSPTCMAGSTHVSQTSSSWLSLAEPDTSRSASPEIPIGMAATISKLARPRKKPSPCPTNMKRSFRNSTSYIQEVGTSSIRTILPRKARPGSP